MVIMKYKSYMHADVLMAYKVLLRPEQSPYNMNDRL